MITLPRNNRTLTLSYLLFATLSTLACSEKNSKPIPTDIAVTAKPEVLLLSQNWNQAERDATWFTSFGSRIMPHAWFMALEQSNSKAAFATSANLSRFGLSATATSAANPDGLPVGLTVTPERDGHRWTGLGCAACHSGQVFYGGTRIHIDGGGSMLNFQLFEQAAISALQTTLKSSAKFARFTAQVAATDPQALRQEMQTWTDQMAARAQVNATASDYGYGRLDAFGQIFNAVAVDFLDIASNRHDPNAPVSYPVLWDAPHLDLVQWNASAPNAGPGPLLQNVTTALAVFGNLDIHHSDYGVGYKSTAELENLGPIQDRYYQLTAPLWPTAVLGQINQDLALKGQALYQQNCLSCHAISNRDEPDRQLTATPVDVAVIGTDPAMAENFVNAKSDTGAFAGKKLLFAAGPTFGAQAPTIQLVAHAAIGALLDHPLEAVREGFMSAHKVKREPVNNTPFYYKARPLSGIWSSAPYLHNGSVPTLAQMLTPAKARQQSFHTGKVEFDVDAVGLSDKILDPQQVSLFDTQLPGNANSGHGYGTELAAAEKRALIEYLKTL